jgi:hypothetical protein
LHPDWLQPDWPAPAHVAAVFTTRQGGVSPAPWHSFNLGDHVGDDAARVAANRALLQQAVGRRPVFLRQVHGNDVLELSAEMPNGLDADACVVAGPGLAATIMVADCLPLLLADEHGLVVAAAHAGWRGLAGVLPASVAPGVSVVYRGVIEAVFESFSAAVRVRRSHSLSHSATKDIAKSTLAWLGPCIGPTRFEVGAEVKTLFEISQPGSGAFFTPAKAPKYLCDLPGLARARLKALGITQIFGNDGSPGWCTVSNPEQYFSHRRDTGPAATAASSAGTAGGTTGRMAACIWLG